MSCMTCISVKSANESSPTLFQKFRPPNNLLLSSSLSAPLHVRARKGPIFEDGPDFETAFRVFHGENAVVPLSEVFPQNVKVEPVSHQFDPLAAKAATISLSGFGDLFGFDSFSMFNNQQKKHKSSKQDSSEDTEKDHFDEGSKVVPHSEVSYPFKPSAASIYLSGLGGFFDSERVTKPTMKDSSQSGYSKTVGNHPFASSYMATTIDSPPISSSVSPPLHHPIFARASERFSFVNNMISSEMVMMSAMGMGMVANLLLGMWRQHTPRFSPYWFVASLATIPFFIPMVCNSVFMPKPFMVCTLGASVLLGQMIGSMAERYRLETTTAATPPPPAPPSEASFHIEISISLWNYLLSLDISPHKISLCGKRASPESNRPAETAAAASAPQPMVTQTILAGAMAMAAKVLLGMWQQHTHVGGISPFTVIVKLCNWILMPKTTMALTFGTCVVGPLIRSMAEQYRLEAIAAAAPEIEEASSVVGGSHQAEATAFRIKVAISLWSYLFSLDVSPLESSFLLSRQLASPPALPP